MFNPNPQPTPHGVCSCPLSDGTGTAAGALVLLQPLSWVALGADLLSLRLVAEQPLLTKVRMLQQEVIK